MGGLPTAERLRAIQTPHNHIQIYGFRQNPNLQDVDETMPGNTGMLLPRVEYFRLEMSSPFARQADFRRLRTTVVTSLRQGNNAY